tara:strand:+ start:7173 stop:7658 length:486 start_codon:yes stop_codon:yes gene_type:complete
MKKDIIERPNSDISENLDIRDKILNFQSTLKSIDNKDIIVVTDKNSEQLCPLTHKFSDGMYVREIFIPAGCFVVGKIHKHDHPNFLLSGETIVVTEEGTQELKGPLSMVSKAGTKRALYAKTDLVWVTVHLNPTNTTDLTKLEKEIIAPSYLEYEKFKQLK